MHGFSTAQFIRRREEALRRLGEGVMVLPSAPILVRSGDSELAYRPDSELFYLSGWMEPDSVLLLRGFADEHREILYVMPRDPAKEQWTGLRKGPEQAGSPGGIPEVRSLAHLAEDLPALLEGADLIHARLGSLPPGEDSVQGVTGRAIFSALSQARSRGARRGRGPRGVVDPGGILDELRLRKDPEEVEALRAAARATVLGFEAAFERLQRGGVGWEWEVEAELVRGFRMAEGGVPAFAPIVASGARGCILHYTENRGAIEEGDLLLLDAGAEVRLYAGDISRTIPVSGRFSTPQRELYQVVEGARVAAVEAIRPGTTVAEVHEVASLTLAQGLVAIGALKGDPETRFREGALRPWFPHQTSHWLGLDTHDPGDYAHRDTPRPLEPGMVLTVEPGLYVPPLGFLGAVLPEGGADLFAPYRGLGIRIEDDVLVTEEGREVLTEVLPTDPEILEMRLSR
jgi:Xaa-Pro aminopeptidase